jgi:hypothetical protein
MFLCVRLFIWPCLRLCAVVCCRVGSGFRILDRECQYECNLYVKKSKVVPVLN